MLAGVELLERNIACQYQQFSSDRKIIHRDGAPLAILSILRTTKRLTAEADISYVLTDFGTASQIFDFLVEKLVNSRQS